MTNSVLYVHMFMSESDSVWIQPTQNAVNIKLYFLIYSLRIILFAEESNHL